MYGENTIDMRIFKDSILDHLLCAAVFTVRDFLCRLENEFNCAAESIPNSCEDTRNANSYCCVNIMTAGMHGALVL